MDPNPSSLPEIDAEAEIARQARHAPLPAPATTGPGLERAGGWMISLGAALACGAAFFALGTWWWWQDWRIGAAPGTVPMAPGTALLLFILGVALLLQQRWEKTTVVRLFGFAAAGLAAAPAFIMGLQQVTGYELAWEQLFGSVPDTVRGFPVGRMSPLSAGVFLLAGGSLAALLPPLAKRRLFLRVGLVTASLGAMVCSIIALAYASQTPLFYGGRIIPMATLTAVGLAALNLALLMATILVIRRRARNALAPHVSSTPGWPKEGRNLLAVFGGLAFGIGLAGFFFLNAQQHAVRRQIANQLETIADFKVSQIVNWRNERLGDARLVMQTTQLARSAAALFSGPDSTRPTEEILAYISVLRRNYRYDAIVLFDRQMTPRLMVPSAPAAPGPDTRALLEAVPGASDVLVSKLHREINGDIHFDLVAPLWDSLAGPGGQHIAPPIGALLLQINPYDFLYPLIKKWPVPSETAETLLVRYEGNEVVYLNDLRHQPNTAFNLRRSLGDRQLPAGGGARGNFGVTEGVDYRGVPVLAAVRAVPGTEWFMVAKEDQAEIYAPLTRQAVAVGTTVLALWLTAALTGTYLWRQNTANFLRRELATETERRSLAERLMLVTQHANDIILLFDEDQRILEANERAQAAYGRTLAEMRQLSVADLRAAGSVSTVAADFSAALTTMGTVFETTHRHRDGSLFPVEVSARLVMHGNRRHVLSIIRDITQRKQAEETLRQSEERFRELFERAPDVNYTHTASGILTALNRAFESVTGWPRAQWLGKSFLPLVHPDDQARALEMVQSVVHGGRAPKFELRILTAEGAFRDVEFTGLALLTGSQSVELQGVGHDITERKRSGNALSESNRRYRETLEKLELIAMSLDRNGTITFCNDYLARLTGWQRSELVGQPWFENFVPDSTAAAKKLFRHAIDTGEVPTNFKNAIRTRSGDLREIVWNNTVLRDADGRVVGTASIGEDVTERLRTEATLRDREKQFSQLLEHASDMITVVNNAGIIRFESPASERILGYRPAERIGCSSFGLVHPEDALRAQQALQTALAAPNQPVGGAIRFRHRDGAWRMLELNARSIPTEAAEGYIIINSRDVTQSRHLEEQFHQAQKMEAIGTLAGGIAHDFNNILGAIIGYAELAKLEVHDNPTATDHLGALLEGANRAADLVRQILAFSRQHEQQRVLVQLRHLVAEPLRLLRATIPTTIEFNTVLASDLPAVLADATQVHQVVMNLCTNAWHAMKDRPGRLEVRLEKYDVDAHLARSNPDLRPGPYVRLTVSDTGHGMDPATIARIFEPFFTTKPPGEGTGLGLSAVHGIMKSHEGAVTVYSQPGEGSTFHLYFPARANESAPVNSAAADVPRGLGEAVLYLDDEKPLALLARDMLVELGYEVTTSTLPKEALAIVREKPEKFALVITDLTMPELTGVDLAKQLLQLRPDLPIILTTGYSSSLTADKVKALGFRELLLKPHTLLSLGTAVHRVLTNSTQT